MTMRLLSTLVLLCSVACTHGAHQQCSAEDSVCEDSALAEAATSISLREVEAHEAGETSALLVNLLQTHTRLTPAVNLMRLDTSASSTCSDNGDMATGYLYAMVLALPVALFVAVSFLGAYFYVVCRYPQEEKKASAPAQPGAGPATAPPEEVSPPVNLYRLVIAGNVMLATNFTIVMPASEEVLARVAANSITTAFSGLIIGSYAIGCMMSLPLMLSFSRTNCRGAMLFLAFSAIIGNFTYAAAASYGSDLYLARWGLVAARIICGFEGGCIIVFQNCFLRFSSGSKRVQAVADLTAASSVGLLLGPSLASASSQSLAWLTTNQAHRDLLPPTVMAILAVIYGSCVYWYCPTQKQCYEQCPQSKDPPMQVYPDAIVAKSGLNLLLQSVVNTVRYIQRVCWEASTLIILEHQFNFTVAEAGYLVAAPLVGLLLLPVMGGRTHKAIGTANYIHLMDAWMFFGLIFMFKAMSGSPQTGNMYVFLIGSFFFYTATWAQSVGYTPLRGQYALPGHWLLNLETSTGAYWVLSFIGYFLGPVLGRAALQKCIDQDMLPTFLLVINVAFILAKEPALRLLLASPAQAPMIGKEEPAKTPPPPLQAFSTQAASPPPVQALSTQGAAEKLLIGNEEDTDCAQERQEDSTTGSEDVT